MVEINGKKRETMSETLTERPPLNPLVYGTEGMCEALDISVATLHRLKASGKLPAAQKLGGQLRWSVSEIEEWIKAGMPDQKTWEAMRDANKGRR